MSRIHSPTFYTHPQFSLCLKNKTQIPTAISKNQGQVPSYISFCSYDELSNVVFLNILAYFDTYSGLGRGDELMQHGNKNGVKFAIHEVSATKHIHVATKSSISTLPLSQPLK